MTSAVSVIVPAYNATAYLDAALASIAGQTRPADEVVVVDDASTDDTADIATSWADRLPIRLIEKPVNEGLGAARRTAIDASTAEFLALLDSDDVWFPDHLATMLDHYEARPGIVTAGNYRWWPSERTDPRPSWEINPIPPVERQRTEILRRNFLFVGTLFRRVDYDLAGGFSARRKSEDWDLWLRMIRRVGLTASCPDSVTVLYRQRSDSLSSLDGTLADDLEVLAGIEDATPDEQRVIDTTIRQITARQDFIAAYEHASTGDVARARRLWLSAAVQDRSLRLGRGRNGSTTLRSLAAIAVPHRAVGYRTGLASRSADSRS